MANQTFDFSEALRRMKEGKKVCRSAFKKKIFSIEIYNGKEYLIFADDGERVIHFINDDNILAKDWEEVEE